MTFSGRIQRGPMAEDSFQAQFTRIYSGLFRDPRLSFKAKGVFGLLSTHRDGHGLSLETIAACATDGISGVRTGLTELIKYRYLRRDRKRDGRGRLKESVYRVTDMPDGLVLYLDPGWDAADAPQDTAQDATPDPERTAVADRGVAVLNDIARECGPEYQLEGRELVVQGRIVGAMLELGWTPAQIRRTVADRPWPGTITTSREAIIAGRLGKALAGRGPGSPGERDTAVQEAGPVHQVPPS